MFFQRWTSSVFKRQLELSNRSQAVLWLSKATVGSALLGYTLSATLLNEDRLEHYRRALASLSASLSELGVLPAASAFSTADHGLHAAHYPWDFHKFWVSYDHAAYALFESS